MRQTDAIIASPMLYVFLGVVQPLVHSPIPGEIVWCLIWLAIAIWSQSDRNPVTVPVPAVGRWGVLHGLTAVVLCPRHRPTQRRSPLDDMRRAEYRRRRRDHRRDVRYQERSVGFVTGRRSGLRQRAMWRASGRARVCPDV